MYSEQRRANIPFIRRWATVSSLNVKATFTSGVLRQDSFCLKSEVLCIGLFLPVNQTLSSMLHLGSDEYIE